jgi:hypothetical protein
MTTSDDDDDDDVVDGVCNAIELRSKHDIIISTIRIYSFGIIPDDVGCGCSGDLNSLSSSCFIVGDGMVIS